MPDAPTEEAPTEALVEVPMDTQHVLNPVQDPVSYGDARDRLFAHYMATASGRQTLMISSLNPAYVALYYNTIEAARWHVTIMERIVAGCDGTEEPNAEFEGLLAALRQKAYPPKDPEPGPPGPSIWERLQEED